MSYFSETLIRVKKGLNSLSSDKVVSVSVLPGGVIKGCVKASIKKKIYEVEMHVQGQSVKYSSCECPIGQEKCRHMAALLIWVEKDASRADVECVWKRTKSAKADEIVAKRVSEMTPSTTQAGIKRPVTQDDKERGPGITVKTCAFHRDGVDFESRKATGDTFRRLA